MTRTFHIGDILSVVTGKLLSPRKMEGVYDILNFMTGDSIVTHAIPRAIDEMREPILDQHPQLASLDMSTFDVKRIQEWLNEQKSIYGEFLELAPAPSDHLAINPEDEPILKNAEVINVQVPK